MIGPLLRVIIIFLCLAGCTDSVSNGATHSPARSAPTAISGEQLRAEPPQGWKQGFATDTPGLRMAEYIPENETHEQWRQKISFESLSGQPLPDPIDFLNSISTDQAGTCEGFESFSTFSGLENGYPTSVQLMVCQRSKLIDKSQVTMIKAIQGNEFFYVVTRAQRGPPLTDGARALNDTEMASWSLYLRAITVCDSERPEHPCDGSAALPAAMLQASAPQ